MVFRMASLAASSDVGGPISSIVSIWSRHGEGRGKGRTCDDDSAVLTPDDNVGIGHFVQTCDVGTFRSDDACEAGAIGEREESDVGRRLGLLDRVPYGAFGHVHARLVTSPQVPCRVAFLGVGVIFDNLPVSLSDGIFDIVDASRLCRRARRTRGQRGSGGLGGNIGFDAEMAKSAENCALRRYSFLILQWDRDSVRDTLRRGGISDLGLQRRKRNHQLGQTRDNEPSVAR